MGWKIGRNSGRRSAKRRGTSRAGVTGEVVDMLKSKSCRLPKYCRDVLNVTRDPKLVGLLSGNTALICSTCHLFVYSQPPAPSLLSLTSHEMESVTEVLWLCPASRSSHCGQCSLTMNNSNMFQTQRLTNSEAARSNTGTNQCEQIQCLPQSQLFDR